MFFILFVLQRVGKWSKEQTIQEAGKFLFLVASIYYYSYKRASLRISDPRFYEDIDAVTDKPDVRPLEWDLNKIT